MRLLIACVGRMKKGADKELFERYVDRARKSGRALGITSVDVRELVESRAQKTADRKQEEATALLGLLSPNTRLVVLDENGKNLSSVAFSEKMASWKDDSVSEIAFVIGGPDGHGDDLLQRADLKVALGAMTWPHQIARILLAEQIYRSITIQSGHPYHRE
ncbi:MAG: 23S rRNA (pseudouridine(1915)-N(3))-methyltransferase RlmH [Rhodobacteraceae bacterium]|nr:23S rRNA (pseudouridine(1915)-N(3))-methyltransferase RlmH [Paracoccaceae bacterium]